MLAVRDLVTAYHGLVALSGVSIDVAQGEIVCVAGANGAGKSTLLKSIAGMEKPRSGSVTFAGTPAKQRSARSRFVNSPLRLTRRDCYTSQGHTLFPEDASMKCTGGIVTSSSLDCFMTG